MKKLDRYYEIIGLNGIRWLFPKDNSGLMTIKEFLDINKGIVSDEWKKGGINASTE